MIKRRRNPKTIAVVLPEVLVEEEILQRLPVKSLLRFKSVSKQWRWTIESTRFVDKHLGCSFSNPKVVVVGAETTRGDDHENLLTFLLETFSRGENEAQIINRFSCSCTFPDPIRLVRLFYKVVGSCDGLICIKDRRDQRVSSDYRTTVYIINPTTRKHRIFHPEQLHTSRDSVSYIGFGKDMVTGTYKMILLSSRINDDSDGLLNTSVLTLDNDNTRRQIGVFPVSRDKLGYFHAPVFANGSVIWFTQPKHRRKSSSEETPIDFVALDLHTEKFRRIMWPSWYVEFRSGMRLWSLKNRLCLSDVQQYPDVDVWSLMEDSSDKWDKIFSINVSRFGRLDTHFWMVAYEAAYLRSCMFMFKADDDDEEETDVDQFPSFTGWQTTLYTGSLVSPYQGI